MTERNTYIKAFNKPNLQDLRGEIAEALKEVSEKFNIDIKLGHITYSATNFSTRLSVATKSDDGVALTKEAMAFERNSKWDGIKAEALGETFRFRGEVYTIAGWNTRARKYPVQATRRDGSKAGFVPVTVRVALRDKGREDLLVEGYVER